MNNADPYKIFEYFELKHLGCHGYRGNFETFNKQHGNLFNAKKSTTVKFNLISCCANL